MRKWHSNVTAFALDEVHEKSKEVPVKANENTKKLGISWNKSRNQGI